MFGLETIDGWICVDECGFIEKAFLFGGNSSSEPTDRGEQSTPGSSSLAACIISSLSMMSE